MTPPIPPLVFIGSLLVIEPLANWLTRLLNRNGEREDQQEVASGVVEMKEAHVDLESEEVSLRLPRVGGENEVDKEQVKEWLQDLQVIGNRLSSLEFDLEAWGIPESETTEYQESQRAGLIDLPSRRRASA